MDKQSGEAAKLYPDMATLRKSFDKNSANVIGFFDNLQDAGLKTYMEIGKFCFMSFNPLPPNPEF